MSKRYYWLKLQQNFFESREIKVLKGMENGSEYILFWLQLLLSSLEYSDETNNIGQLVFKENIPWSVDLMMSVFDFSKEIITGALAIYKKLGMVTITDSGEMWANDIQKLIGSETTEAKRKRDYRVRLSKQDRVPKLSQNCPVELEKELKKEKDFICDLPIVENKSYEKKVTPLKVIEKLYFKLFKDGFQDIPNYNYAASTELIKKYLKEYGLDKVKQMINIWFYCKIGEWHGYNFLSLQKDWNRLLIIYKNMDLDSVNEDEYGTYKKNIMFLNEQYNKTKEVACYEEWRKESIKQRFTNVSTSG